MFGRRTPEQPETVLGQLERLVREKPYHTVSLHCKERGITPRRFYEDVQRTYDRCLQKEDFVRMRLLREMTGIAPSDEVVRKIQEKYFTYTGNSESVKILDLQGASGIPMYDTARARYLQRNIEHQLLTRDEAEQLRSGANA